MVIVNGKVAEEREIEDALSRLRERPGTEVRITARGGEGRRFAREAAEAGADEVVVFGGDGTVNEVVGGLVPPEGRSFQGVLGIVPTGTANDFASCAGLPDESPLEALAALDDCRPVAVDVGRVSRPGTDDFDGDGNTVFVNVATAGFGAEVSSEASPELKGVLGKLSYLAKGIASAGEMGPREALIRAPDFERSVAFYVLAIGNGRCAGGGVRVCPEAIPTDGLFDVTVVPRGSVGATAAEVIRKGLSGMGDAGIRFRAPWVEVRSDRALQVNLDGEPCSGTRFRFDVRPGVLRILLPPASPLLRPPERR